VTLTTFSDLVGDAMDHIRRSAVAANLSDKGEHLGIGGIDRTAYAESVGVYLGEVVSKITSYHCSLCIWRANMDKSGRAFGRQAIPMVWDFPECNPFAGAGGDWDGACTDASRVLAGLGHFSIGYSRQSAAQIQEQQFAKDRVISTDPPYYDNICYADLSDFFYVWLRRTLRPIFPDLFATLAVPKAEELVASRYHHSSKEAAETFFLNGMTQAMHRLAEQAHPAFPVTIYYAFRQAESGENGKGTVSTGWETFLDAVIRAGFAITGTWPIRTEQSAALKTLINSLASSIILVCRKRIDNTTTVTRRDFLAALKSELPEALAHLQRGNIAPVDLAQAAIGPGMAVYTRYAKVLDAEGKPLAVRDALALINQVLDETLAEQEGDFDADSRWALAWFEQFGFNAGEYGVAETLSKAKNTSVEGLVDAGFLQSKGGKVRILQPSELPADWDPEKDKRLTNWEVVHHLIRVLESGGEAEAAKLVAKLGSKAEIARELCYRLYTLCERKKRAAEALSYNALVQSWPEISRLAADQSKTEESQTPQSELFEND